MDVQATTLERAEAMGYRPVGGPGTTDFPVVYTHNIFDQHGKAIPSYQRIAREDTGDTLAIHTDAYHLRPFGESFTMLEKAIYESPLELDGLMVKTAFSHNGGRCFRSYLFPHTVITARGDDHVALQILAFDSYDGSYSTSLAAGGFRFICLNGSFFGKTIQQLKIRHTRGSLERYEDGLDKVIEAADQFANMQPRLRRWTEVPVEVIGFKELIERGLPQCTTRLADHLVSRWATESEEGTLYGAWNLLTTWAGSNEGSAQSRVDRDRRVASLIESKPWRVLEDA